MTAPTIPDGWFDELKELGGDAVARRFEPFVRRELHGYLNQLAAFKGLQTTRARWKRRVEHAEAFGNFAADPAHWYTFHHGGRNEMQFNVGMAATHLRIGVGFEFSMRRHGDPTIVGLIYSVFRRVAQERRGTLEALVQREVLEVEWLPKDAVEVRVVPSSDVLAFLDAPPNDLGEWLFVGRLLRRGIDRGILEDSGAVGRVYASIFEGLRPLWEETMVRASGLR